MAAPLIRIPFSPSSHGLPPFSRHTKASLLPFGKSDPPSPFSSSSFHSLPSHSERRRRRGRRSRRGGLFSLSTNSAFPHRDTGRTRNSPNVPHFIFWGKVLVCFKDNSIVFLSYLRISLVNPTPTAVAPVGARSWKERERKRSRKLSQQQRRRGIGWKRPFRDRRPHISMAAGGI